MNVADTNVCLVVLYYYQDGDWLYLLNHICVYKVVISSTSISHPFAVSYLAFTPLPACEASVATYPINRLGIKCYWAKICPFTWLRTNHRLDYLVCGIYR